MYPVLSKMSGRLKKKFDEFFFNESSKYENSLEEFKLPVFWSKVLWIQGIFPFMGQTIPETYDKSNIFTLL